MDIKPSILFLRNGVPEKIVIFIYMNNHREMNYSKLSRSICATYSATCKNIKILEDLGILEILDLDKKSKRLKLTPRGEKVFKCIKEFDNI